MRSLFEKQTPDTTKEMSRASASSEASSGPGEKPKKSRLGLPRLLNTPSKAPKSGHGDDGSGKASGGQASAGTPVTAFPLSAWPSNMNEDGSELSIGAQSSVLPDGSRLTAEMAVKSTAKLRFPADYSRRHPSIVLAAIPFSDVLAAETRRRIAALSQHIGVKMRYVLLAAYAITLARFSNQKLVPLGGFMRRSELGVTTEAEQLCSYNFDVLVDGTKNFAALVIEIKRTLAARRYANAAAAASSATAFKDTAQAMLLVNDQPIRLKHLDLEANIARYRQAICSDVPIEIVLELCGSDDAGLAVYNEKLFAEATIESFVRSFTLLLEQAVADPQTILYRLPLLTESAERSVIRLITKCDRERLPGSAHPVRLEDDASQRSLLDCFYESVRNYPDRTAVIGTDDEGITYAHIDAVSTRIARFLKDQWDVVPGQIILIALPRGPDYVAGILATQKLGCAYLPILNENLEPLDRAISNISVLFERIHGTPVILTSTEYYSAMTGFEDRVILLETISEQLACYSRRPFDFVAEFGDAAADVNRQRPGDRVACMLYHYPCGRTNVEPAQILVTQQSLMQNAQWHQQALVEPTHRDLEADREPRMALMTPPGDSFTLFSVWAALCNGITLVCIGDLTRSKPEAIAACCIAHRVTIIHAPGGMVNMMRKISWHKSQLRLTVGDGYIVPMAKLRPTQPELRERDYPGKTIQVFGAPECGLFSMYRVVTDDQTRRPLGDGTAVTQAAMILSQDLEVLPAGVLGELFICSRALGQGYRLDDALTASLFLRNPYAHHTGANFMFRTGHCGYYGHDGTIYTAGLMPESRQKKQYAIDLVRVEDAIKRSGYVLDVIVELVDENSGLGLYGWVIPKSGVDVVAMQGRLHQHLKKRIPTYMIPRRILSVPPQYNKDHLPRSSTGGIDYAGLTEILTQFGFDPKLMLPTTEPVQAPTPAAPVKAEAMTPSRASSSSSTTPSPSSSRVSMLRPMTEGNGANHRMSLLDRIYYAPNVGGPERLPSGLIQVRGIDEPDGGDGGDGGAMPSHLPAPNGGARQSLLPRASMLARSVYRASSCSRSGRKLPGVYVGSGELDVDAANEAPAAHDPPIPGLGPAATKNHRRTGTKPTTEHEIACFALISRVLKNPNLRTDSRVVLDHNHAMQMWSASIERFPGTRCTTESLQPLTSVRQLMDAILYM
ncbi:hypothetical protein CXG81DRAFT_19263 [Caulochytrium protostelioides]|uniref:AMP-dependent synthetase/ligase domain-containing protein n=1 Tax=Caulochytrium protostelioides TaxID=1555241 RepID=A0A4P9X6Q9_9FUNG|nr:hypothetical protein CXG81DRAFT_19263 [Caulochytrium protostelioides]|eukprot:RKP00865.1 hypothetical protein CXG81DRAFT_19263 [Caulochytrium protostelioides]